MPRPDSPPSPATAAARIRQRALDATEVAEHLAARPAWVLNAGKLERELRFADFRSAFAFMTAVALAAERMDHHPEWSNAYNRVRIQLTTHSVGGLSDLDFELASIIDALAAPLAGVATKGAPAE